MSSQRKRARSSTNSSIDSLPEEVMCMIFDQLCIYDIKSASLTCRRWNNIIFRSNYVSRFKLNVNLRNVDAASKSQRRYRNVKWAVYDRELRSMWDIIHPNIANNLYSLEISCTKHQFTASTMALMSESIPLMTQLRSFTLIDNSRNIFDQNISLTLRSNSVSRLKFISSFRFRVDMPELQTFEGKLSALSTPDECIQPPALDKLKELTVSHYNMDSKASFRLQISIATLKSLFRRMTNIEKMEWNIIVPDAIFNAICEICTTLKELAFDYEISYSNIVNLNKVKHLRRLRIWAIRFEHETRNVNSVLNWSKLTHMEHISLGYEVEHALELPTSVKKLEVCIDSNNQERMIKTITNSGAHLKELKVVISDRNGNGTDYDEPVELLKALSCLKHLEVLIFYHGLFLESSFLRIKTPLVRLRKLRFYDAYLQTSKPLREILKMSVSSFEFSGLKKKFPNLNEPEYLECSITPGSDSEYDSEYDSCDSCPSDSD